MWALLAVPLLCALAGCSNQRPTFTKASGYVNLDALVRASPGWKNIAQLTDDIDEIERARTAAATPAFQTNMATLPPIAALKTQGFVEAPEHEELWRREQRDLKLVANQREKSRNEQLDRQQETWALKASDDYDAAVAALNQNYADTIDNIYLDQTADRISLELQVDQLTKLLVNWELSLPDNRALLLPPPGPTPILDDSKAQLSAKLLQLKSLQCTLAEKLAAARTERDMELAQRRKERDSYVPLLYAKEQNRLETLDNQHLAAESARLSEQITQLLAENAAAQNDSILKLEALKPDAESMDGIPAAPNDTRGEDLAVNALIGQRNRRKAFLYDTVRASALKIAAQQHWNINFVKNGSTRTDLTGKIAAIMAARSTD